VPPYHACTVSHNTGRTRMVTVHCTVVPVYGYGDQPYAKYRDVPDFVHSTFNSLSVLPSTIETLHLPNTRMSVPAFIAYSLPTKTPVQPLPDPFSYFSNSEPHEISSASTSLLRSLPIPPRAVLDKIIHQAGQAWLDGYKSIVYSHTGHDRRFPFWILQYWKRVTEILPAHQAWTSADRYLTTLQKKSSEHTRRAADDFRALLHALPWDGKIYSFSDDDAVHRLAAFASRDWLADIHETFMLEELQRQIAAIPEFGTKQIVVNIWISNKIRIAYEQRDNNEYPPPHRTELAELGADLASGAKSRLGLLWFIKGNHWCSMDIIADGTRQVILYGDPEGDEAPDWLHEATIWWLSKHIKGSFEWGVLACPLQQDGFSCGILAQNGLAHSFIPARYPLIDASSGQDVAIACLMAGGDVIRHHIQMVSDPISFYFTGFTHLGVLWFI
jgi:hypothetical protein